MMTVQVRQVFWCDGAELGVQRSRYTGVQLIKVPFLYFIMGSCRAMKKCSTYGGVQLIKVFKLTGSTVQWNLATLNTHRNSKSGQCMQVFIVSRF